jgi:hypothetical protein
MLLTIALQGVQRILNVFILLYVMSDHSNVQTAFNGRIKIIDDVNK